MSKKRLEAAIQIGREIQEVGVSNEDLNLNRSVIESVKEIHTFSYDESRDGVYSVQYNHDGSKIVVGYGDGGIELLSLSSSKGLKHKKALKKGKLGGLAVTCIKFLIDEDHLCLAGTCEGNVHMCNIRDGTYETVVKEPANEINCLDLNCTGSRFATAGKDLTIRIYDTATCSLVNKYTGFCYDSPEQSNIGHAQRIFALHYFPKEETVFVSGGWDNHLKIWDSRTADGVIGTIHGPHICGDSVDIQGTTLLSGSWVASDAVQLWDLGSCSLIQNVPVRDHDQGEFIYCCRLCDDGVVLSAGSGTQSVQAFNLDTNKFLGEIELHRPVQALETIDGGRQFVFGGGGSMLKFGTLE